MNSYINLLPAGQTPCPNPCPLFLLLPQQHRVLPLSSSSSPKQQHPLHSNTTKTFCPLLLLPQHSNTTKMLWCIDAALCLLPQTTKTQPLALRLLDHDLLPSTRHCTKDEDYRLRQWWISSTEPLFKGFWKGHGLTGLFQIFTGFLKIFIGFIGFLLQRNLWFLWKIKICCGAFCRESIEFFPRVDRVNSEYRSTHPSLTDLGWV